MPSPTPQPASAPLVAPQHQLYNPGALAAAAARVTDKDLQPPFAALGRRGSSRPLLLATSAQEKRIRSLLARAPHMAEATDAVLAAVAIARRAKSAVRLAPLLLTGPPASGKTWWARQVAEALGVPATVLVMPKVTASFVLSGSTPSWSSARPGRIVEAFEASEVASPLIVLDEIEKVSTGRYDPSPVLLDLLDTGSARRWHDEFFGIDFDVSPAIFVATCNDPTLLDPALRSRFREIQVRAPKADAMPAIIHSTWATHRRLYPGLRLPATLPGPAISHLAMKKLDMRSLQRLFDDAIGKAAQRRGRLRILPADLGAPAAVLVREARR